MQVMARLIGLKRRQRDSGRLT